MANMRSQFTYLINSAFEENYDKHSAKSNGGTDEWLICSRSSKKNMHNFSNQFASWIKLEAPEFRLAKDLNLEIAQKFIDQKAASGKCSEQTIKTYQSNLKKLGSLINHQFKAKVDFKVVRPSVKNKGKIRNIAFLEKDYQTVMEKTKNSQAFGRVGFEMGDRFGLRVSEAVKVEPRDLNENEMKLHIHRSKGGRSRDIPITKDDIAWLKTKAEGFKPWEKIVPIRANSINAWLSANLKKLNINRYLKAKTGIHALRKKVAQEKYDEFRSKGLSQNEALDKVSHYLGHGDNRFETMREYVLNL